MLPGTVVMTIGIGDADVLCRLGLSGLSPRSCGNGAVVRGLQSLQRIKINGQAIGAGIAPLSNAFCRRA